MAETRHAHQPPTPLQRSWARLVAAATAAFVTVFLPRAQATSWEAIDSTYGSRILPRSDAELPKVDAVFFAPPAVIELLLLALALGLGLAIRLRPDRARDLRPSAYAVAVALPGWVTLVVLIPGLGEAPFRVLPAGWVAIAAAATTGALLAAHATGAARITSVVPDGDPALQRTDHRHDT